MIRRRVSRAFVLVAALLAAGGCAPADGPVRAALRARVDPARHGVDSRFPQVVRFYRARNFRPAWTTSIGARREAFELEVALDRAQSEGVERKGSEALRIHDLLGALRPTLFGPLPPPHRLAELDVLLTRSYFASAAQVLGGRIHARDLPIDWRTGPRVIDLVADLTTALQERQVIDALHRLEPQHPGYAALRTAWERYRAIDAGGGWRRVGPGPRMRVGRIAARVAALRERLAAEEDLAPPLADSTRFDLLLAQAVRRFQRRYGLDTTGIVGPRDIEALDVPAADRARQIELNLVRWHWVPDSLGERYVLVNIPEYTLRVMEQDRVVNTMRVVVGKPDWPTPVFSAPVRYVVFNPLWNVPATIAAAEVLSEVQNDPDYLARNNIRVYQGEGRDAPEMDPATIHWSLLTAADLPYSFREDPGPANPVGHVKFMCPNPFSVYLHDTPSSQYFRRIDRAYSHGCVRVEKPLELAEYVLAGRPGWDHAGIAAAVDTSRNQAVGVPVPLPVHILYFTAWVDEDGQVEFRRDIYGLDDLLDKALKGLPLPTREQLDQARDQNSLVRVTSNPSDR